MEQYASAEDFARYVSHLNDSALRKAGDLINCANDKCQYPGYVDLETTSFAYCSQCGKQTCVECGTLWHGGLTHEENQAAVQERNNKAKRQEEARHTEEESRSKRAIEKDSKECKCGARIQKISGCDHMTCKSLLPSSPSQLRC
jgi:hypothetical protein